MDEATANVQKRQSRLRRDKVLVSAMAAKAWVKAEAISLDIPESDPTSTRFVWRLDFIKTV